MPVHTDIQTLYNITAIGANIYLFIFPTYFM